MKISMKMLAVIALGMVALSNAPAQGQVLYQQNFDVDDTANWTINPGNPDVAQPPGSPPSSSAADIFFDYNGVGIPSAPRSTGGTTRGMRLQANVPIPGDPTYTGVFGGFSVSPTGKSFTGDYKLTFDWWSNYIGADKNITPPGGINAGASGSSTLSLFGIGTADTFSNSPGFASGLYFAATGDGGSASDYRVYAPERASSYQLPLPPTDPNYNALDEHANYLAASRNNTAALYATAFGGGTVPAAQTALFPETQFGTAPAGTPGFAWQNVEITSVAGLVTWKVNDVALITVDTTKFAPDKQLGGANILFGSGDINSGFSTDPYFPSVQFTLIDNVEVTALTASAGDADFDGDGDVDGADFLVWQRGLGLTGQTDKSHGDANGDGNVNGADLGIWAGKFGGPPAVGAAGAVPEPAAGCIAIAAAISLGAVRRRRGAAA